MIRIISWQRQKQESDLTDSSVDAVTDEVLIMHYFFWTYYVVSLQIQ